MSNLVDKTKLIDAITKLGTSVPQLLQLMEQVAEGELDFHPVAPNVPSLSAPEDWQVSTVRKTCSGLVMGKACVKFAGCDFAQGKTDLPCSDILAAFKQRNRILKRGDVLVWEPGMSNRWAFLEKQV